MSIHISPQVRSRIEDLKVVRERTTAHRRRVLQEIASTYEGWRRRVLTEKAIYHTMNFFNYDVGRKCLMAEGTVIKSCVDDVRCADV